jgi:hypothetical protein
MKKRYQDTDLIAIATDISLKAAVASLMVFSLLLLLTGCALFSSPDRPGYQAGRTTAVVWMATEDMQPEQLRSAGLTGYRVLQTVYGQTDNPDQMDALAEQVIDRMLADGTEVQKAIVMNFYVMARNRLEREVTDRESRLAILESFTEGIEDALADYGERPIKKGDDR